MNKVPEKAGEEHRGVPPRPYLSRLETNERLLILGFGMNSQGQLEDTATMRQRMQALEDLLAAAIAEWVGMEFEEDGKEGDAASVVAELQEWAEEYLVG